MAVEQIRPVEGQRKAAQRKTQELNVDTAITILFGTSRLEGDSFISTLRYARNEGMLEGTPMNEIEKGTSLVDLTKYTKEVAAQGNFAVAATLHRSR